MADLLSAVQAELSGARAANYSSLSDAAAATALMASGQIYQDVPIGTVAGFVELNYWDGKAPPYIMEQLQALAAGPASAIQVVATKAVRLFTANTPISAFELSDPAKLAGIKAMLGALVQAGMAQSAADAILALGVPQISPQIVTAARVLNGVKYPPYDWQQSPPVPDSNPSNAVVTVTITTTGGQTAKSFPVSSPTLTQALINQQAAINLATLVARDAAIKALGG